MAKIKNIAVHHYFGVVRFIMIVVLVLAATIGVAFAYRTAVASQILTGVTFGQINLSGLTREQAQNQLQSAWDKFSQVGIVVSANDKQVILKGLVSSPTDPDLTYELVNFDTAAAVNTAWSIGRRGTWLQQIIEPILIKITGYQIDPKITLEFDRVKEFIILNLPEAQKLPRSADFVIDDQSVVKIDPEQSGLVIDDEYLAEQILERFNNFSNRPLALKLIARDPEIKTTDLESLLPELQVYLKPASLEFKFNDQKWVAEPKVWHQWFSAVKFEAGTTISFNQNKAAEFFNIIKKEVDQPAREGKFEMQNNRVTTFEPSQVGQEVNVAAILNKAQLGVTGEITPVELVVSETEPKLTTESVNNLGIKEIIGVGKSNFAGSPRNRRKNIAVGAAALNGIVIQPEEEFSLIKTLGNIDAAAGYLTELVIKGDKTVPEFGGGLCQIGTTTFRSALGSGLPITERRSHSYRVPYYEPAGTDATIYDPKPDFRFKNDTGNAILIQTKIQGDELIFEFWGKKDGRVAEQTKPRVYNIVRPPEAKLVETEDLPVGQKKCTERAHVGADAEFKYTVTYPSSEKKEVVFKSHYVPWQEVCLIGVPKGTLSKPVTDGTALPSADIQGQSGSN
ncbi:MAG: VanW family protein [Patescibacteria group bacterium]